jgi:hypothetical protein
LPAETLALLREPSLPTLPPWGDRPISFLRDIQPVLNRHCTGCHSGLKPAGGLDFCGGLVGYDQQVAGYGHNRAFETILERELVCLSPARAQDASITPPLAYGSHKSKLLTALADATHKSEVRLSNEDHLRLAMWIDANAPYHDRFVNKRAAIQPYNLTADQDLVQSLRAIHQRRCAECHAADEVTRVDWIDIYQPARSVFLAAPLPSADGGAGGCGTTVYRGGDDPDYRAALARVQTAVDRLWAEPRRDVRSLREADRLSRNVVTTLRRDDNHTVNGHVVRRGDCIGMQK